MRRIPKLTDPDHEQKSFYLKDFSKYTQSCTGLNATEDGLTVTELGVAQTILELQNLSVQKLYRVRESFYAYLEDGNLVKYDGAEWVQICESQVQPCVIAFSVEGEDCTLVLGDQSLIVKDDGQVQTIDNLPSAKCAVVYKNMLFIGESDKIWFSKLFDYQNFTDGLNNSGFISTDENFGEILALIPRKSYLVVVCERAIYHLNPVGERQSYTLIKQDVAVDVMAESVQNAGEVIYLFSENAFCKYKNGIITKVDCEIIDGLTFDNQSGIDANAYYAKLINGEGETYLFNFNGVTGEANLLNAQSLKICDGGYYIEGDDIKRLTQERVVSAQELSWQSAELDFGSPLIKSLVGIEVKTNLPVEVRLEYSYGNRTLSFARGLSLVKTFVTDKSFKVKLSFNNPSTKIEYVKFNYRLQED